MPGLGVLSDFAGIYLSSESNTCWEANSTGCALRAMVRHNLVHAGRHFDYGSEGIYTDEQASNVTLVGNTIYDGQRPIVELRPPS